MYFGSFLDPGLEILRGEGDGSNLRLLHENNAESRSQTGFSSEGNEIYILRTVGNGSLSIMNSEGIETRITHYITGWYTVPKALFAGIAILQQDSEVYSLFFW